MLVNDTNAQTIYDIVGAFKRFPGAIKIVVHDYVGHLNDKEVFSKCIKFLHNTKPRREYAQKIIDNVAQWIMWSGTNLAFGTYSCHTNFLYSVFKYATMTEELDDEGMVIVATAITFNDVEFVDMMLGRGVKLFSPEMARVLKKHL